MSFTSQGKKEMCTSVVIRCPQDVHNCDSLNNLSNCSVYIKCMILKWKKCGSCRGLIYNHTEPSAREIWRKPCHPVKESNCWPKFEPGPPEYDAGGANLFIRARELQLSHETVLPLPFSITHRPQNANNMSGKHVPPVRRTKYIFLSVRSVSSGNSESGLLAALQCIKDFVGAPDLCC